MGGGGSASPYQPWNSLKLADSTFATHLSSIVCFTALFICHIHNELFAVFEMFATKRATLDVLFDSACLQNLCADKRVFSVYILLVLLSYGLNRSRRFTFRFIIKNIFKVKRC